MARIRCIPILFLGLLVGLVACPRTNDDDESSDSMLPVVEYPQFKAIKVEPLVGCLGIGEAVQRQVLIANPGNAVLEVMGISYRDNYCIYPSLECAEITAAPLTFSVAAGDIHGVAVMTAVDCPDDASYDSPISGALVFHTNMNNEPLTTVPLGGWCTSDTASCWSDFGPQCVSPANPPCSEIQDLELRRRCMELCCPGSPPEIGCPLR